MGCFRLIAAFRGMSGGGQLRAHSRPRSNYRSRLVCDICRPKHELQDPRRPATEPRRAGPAASLPGPVARRRRKHRAVMNDRTGRPRQSHHDPMRSLPSAISQPRSGRSTLEVTGTQRRRAARCKIARAHCGALPVRVRVDRLVRPHLGGPSTAGSFGSRPPKIGI